MLVIHVMVITMEVRDIVFSNEGDNDCVRCNGDDDGSDGHCYKIEALMRVINVMAIVMDIVIGLKL